MNMYLWVKYLHILSSTILFGTGIGTASVMLYAYLQPEIKVKAAIYRYVVIADWVFTGSTGLIQIITGFLLVYLAHFPITMFWIMGGIIGYWITALCWFVVVYLQIQISKFATYSSDHQVPLPTKYYSYFRWWIFLGWPAFISLLFVFYCMIMKPTWS
jgi:uncharacterized membrane protein